MKIGVVIPIIQLDYVVPLLENIRDNTRWPDKIIIVDNRNKSNQELKTGNRVIHYKTLRPLSVNESWNYGITNLLDCDLISVLNDDLVIEKYFFEKILCITSLAKYENVNVFCPHTTNSIHAVKNALQTNKDICYKMNKREGWAWTIRGEAARKMPLIPDILRTFCGDDWVWRHVQPWYKMSDVLIYHYIGRSTRIQNRGDLKSDKKNLIQSV